MSLIRNAIVFSAELPTSVGAIDQHLSEASFVEPTPSQPASSGFVSMPEWEGAFAIPFHGGLAFAFRTDTKVIPSSAVKAEIETRVKWIEDHEARKPGRKERRGIKDDVMHNLCLKALARTQITICYYDQARKFLFIPTTSVSTSDRIVTALIRAIGSVKTSTIHVDNVRRGLTTCLKAWLDGDDEVFGEFEVGGEVTLISFDKRKLTVKSDRIDSNSDGLKEAIARRMDVTQISLMHGACSFKLTDSFRLKGIKVVEDMNADADTEIDWKYMASFELLNISKVMEALCAMFSYKNDDEVLE